MAFVEPVTLRGAHVALEPLAREHEPGLSAAAADGELWRLWYTSDPGAGQDGSGSTRRSPMREKLGAMPFVVREPASGDMVGSTRYFNVEPTHRRLEIGHTWYAKRVQRTAIQHRGEATCCSRTRSRRSAASPSSSARASSTSRRARRSRGSARSRTACCATIRSCPTARARHRRLQHHRARMAGGEEEPQLAADAVGQTRLLRD